MLVLSAYFNTTRINTSGCISVCKKLLKEITEDLSKLVENIEKLKKAVDESEKMADDFVVKAEFVRDNIAGAMLSVREYADQLETAVDREFWPVPTYSDLIYSV